MKSPFELAQAEMGTKEIAGPKHNPVVVAYFRDAGFAGIQDDETAWCAAFVGAMLKRAGIKPSGSLAARSYLQWGEKVAIEDARPGDIVVFRRGNSTWQGHVGFFVRQNAKTITVLGGNQANEVNQRNYSTADLLGVRRVPASRPNIAPAPAPAPTTATKTPSGGKTLAAIIAAAGAALALWWASTKAALCALPIISLICGG